MVDFPYIIHYYFRGAKVRFFLLLGIVEKMFINFKKKQTFIIPIKLSFVLSIILLNKLLGKQTNNQF